MAATNRELEARNRRLYSTFWIGIALSSLSWPSIWLSIGKKQRMKAADGGAVVEDEAITDQRDTNSYFLILDYENEK